MDADFDLSDDGTIVPAKPKFKDGRGRPKGWSQSKSSAAKKGLDPDENHIPNNGPEDVNDLTMRKARAMADKAEADAANAWLKYKVDSMEYLSRTAYRESTATVISQISQALRSLPDVLERKYGLPPEQVLQVEKTIDGVLSDAAETLEMFVQQEPVAVKAET